MKYLKKSFQKMEPYFSKNIVDGIILNANESPFLPPQEVIDKIQKEILSTRWNRYPDMQATALVESIAKHFKVKANEICCGVGSDELLETTFKAVLETGDIVLSFSPSFSMYKVFADLAMANFVEVPFLDSGFPVEKMLQKIEELQPKLVLICSPNNPTGAFLDREEIIRIIESTQALVVLDLAYIDFAREDYTDLATKYDNLIVFRTFSKAMAFPSLRVGYAISIKDNIDMIQAVKAPYSVCSVSQLIAKIAIENYSLYIPQIEKIKKEREYLYNELKKKYKVFPSDANFLYMGLPISIYEELCREKIYIRKITDTMYRITVGSKEENKRLLGVVMKHEK